MSHLIASATPRSAWFGFGKVCVAFTCLLSSIATAGVVPIQSPEAASDGLGAPLQILWTNDTHGFFLPVYHAEYSEMDTYEQTAATEGKVGGYAQIAGLAKALRGGIWTKNTLFMDAGDTFDGSPVAQKTRGQAVVPVLNAMGYDAWTPGNRDFAWTKADFYSITSQLNFPMICSNLTDTATGQSPFPRYLIKQIGGLKVALLGLTGLAGAGVGHTPDIGFSATGGDAMADEITALAADVRTTEDPDLVVIISHMGYYIDQKLAANTTGIDVIVGAHTHHNVYTPPVIANADGSRNVIIVQAGSHGKFLGRLQLWVKNKKVNDYAADVVRVSAESLANHNATPDAAVEQLALDAYAPFKAEMERVIGNTSRIMVRRGDTQSTMVNFLTDAMAERYGVDVARFPGIRYGATILPGPLTVGDVWNIVSPNFGNDKMFTFAHTGAQIFGLINTWLNAEYGTEPYNWNGGDVFRLNGRVKYTYKVNAAANQHIQNMSVEKEDGTVVNLVVDGVKQTQNFGIMFTNVATFPANGPPPASIPVKNASGKPVSAIDEIVSYIESKGTIAPELDDRTVQLDNVETNVSDVTEFTTTPAPVLNAPGLLIAPGQN